MGAFFANLNTEIYEGRFDEAAETVQAMRRFINSPTFQSLRSIQARRELYTQAINSFETMIDEVRRFQAAGLRPPDRNIERTLAELQEQNTRLGQAIEEKDRTIAAFSSEGSGQTRRLAELERSVNTLRTTNSELEERARERDSRITSLETSLATQTRNTEEARREATGLQTEVATLSQTVTTRDTTIRELQAQNTAHEENIANLNTQLNSIRNALQALSQ